MDKKDEKLLVAEYRTRALMIPRIEKSNPEELMSACAEAFALKGQIVYNRTKSPLIPWLYYRIIRRCGHPVPEWILDHMDGVAERLDAIEEKGPHGFPSQVMDALSFSSGKVFTRRQRVRKQSFEEFHEVQRDMDEHYVTAVDAITEVAKLLEISRSTLQKHYDEAKKQEP